MSAASGRMTTIRAERYAKQLTCHWSARGPVTEEHGALVQRWDDGQVLILRPAGDHLHIEVSVAENGDVTRFAEFVKAHLERFGQRDELSVVWDQPAH